LAFQIRTSCDGAKGVVARIGGGEAVPIEDNETTFAQFYARIDRTLEILKGAKRDAFNAPDVGIEIKLGPKTYKFNSIDFAQKCKCPRGERQRLCWLTCDTVATPNFFFHVTTAYAILRNAGVPVGKRDYLGHSLFVEA
jgi:hypothetical protein